MDSKERTPVVLDTSVLMNCLESLKNNIENYEFVILTCVLSELDNLNKGNNKRVSKKARDAINFILDNISFIRIESIYDEYSTVDDTIVNFADFTMSWLSTCDNVMKIKAGGFGVSLFYFDIDKSEKDEYKGYKEIILNDEEMALLYESKENCFGLLENEYLIVKNNNGKIVDKFRNVNNKLFSVGNKSLSSMYIGNCKPLDIYQSLFIDSLNNNDVTLVKGKAGTGKTLISLTYAMQMIEKGKYDKLIVFVNPVNTKDSAKLGFYPGSRDEKIMDSFVGSMLASKFGGSFGVNQLIAKEKLILLPFSDIRGFDTSGMRAIVYIVEAQNLTIELMKLAIQRVGDDCKLIIDGDYQAQVDMSVYEGFNNGMRRLSETFRGQEFYGEVELQKIYRSRYASVADKM